MRIDGVMATEIGSFIIDIEGHVLTPEERELLAHPLIGGVILFSRNHESRQQLETLCLALRAVHKTPLLIMVDQEGGRVQRFKHAFTRLPPMEIVGKRYDADPRLACELAKKIGWLMATELLNSGVDLSLAPVLDLNKGINGAIGDRSFHQDPSVVTRLASAFIDGMREAGMAAVGKHFPGHGSVTADSHTAIPVDERSLQEVFADDVIPFAALIKNGISAMMAAHIIFPQIDRLAVGFSSIWLRDILRKRLGFTGAIFSDDLNMQGADISSNYTDRVVAAREAGCDFTLLCNNRRAVIEVLDNLPYQLHRVGKEKWGGLQGKFSQVKPLHEDKRWRETHELLLTLSA